MGRRQEPESFAEVGRRLGVTRQRVHQLVAAGKLELDAEYRITEDSIRRNDEQRQEREREWRSKLSTVALEAVRVARCPKCGASRGKPCTVVADGSAAQAVHSARLRSAALELERQSNNREPRMPAPEPRRLSSFGR